MKLVIQIAAAFLMPVLILGGLYAMAKKKLPFVHHTGIDTRRGEELFALRCARCHNLGTSPYLKFGPNLEGVANRVRLFEHPMEAADYMLESILTPDAYRAVGFGVMPKNLVSDLSDSQIKDLLAYVLGDPHFGRIQELSIPAREKSLPSVEITRAEAELGERVFREKGTCVRCHGYYQTPEYHTLAPNLFQAGYRDLDYIRLAIKQPSQSVPDQCKTTVVQLADGRTMSGRQVHSKDPHRLELLIVDSQGSLSRISIDRADIEQHDGRPQIELQNKSIMPDEYEKLLTPEEIDAVSKMILSLNE